MKIFFVSLTILFSSLLTGCNLLPGHSDYACKLEDSYGKCMDSAKAYQEAVTGADFGHEITDDGVKDDPKASAGKAPDQAAAPASKSYSTYRDRVYSQTAKLIDAPQTPVITQPNVVRTLILSYSPSLNGQVAYMPRYVFTVLEGPKFVLSQYQLNSMGQTTNFLTGGMTR